MTDAKTVNTARRLSFAEEASQADSKKQPQRDRKQSIWNAQAKNMLTSSRRLSMSHSSRKSSQDLLYPRIRLQNTYRMEPNENEKFKPYKVEPKLYALLEDSLKNKKYDATRVPIWSKDLSQELMREARLIMNNASMRYKLVSHIVIGEFKGQDVRVGSRCLWDNNLDNCASVVYKNNTLYAVATVFAIYFE
jgi:hypothetical protein